MMLPKMIIEFQNFQNPMLYGGFNENDAIGS